VLKGRVQPQAPPDVLHVDDRVVDDNAERDDQAGEHHRVDGAAVGGQQPRRRHQRERHGENRNQRAAPFVEKGDQYGDDERSTEQHRQPEVPERHLDERRRAEDA
jgi:hypothetical protein